MNPHRSVVSLFLNLFVAASTVYSLICCFSGPGKGYGLLGTVCFRYFTVDSNILAALTCLPVLWFTFRDFFGKEEKCPGWVSLLKLVGTAAVTVTFLTVLCFLGPMLGYGAMAAGNNLFLHIINPVCMLASFLLLDEGKPLGKKLWLLGDIPVVMYGTLYAVMVLLVKPENGGWEDFYGFNIGGLWPVSIVAMFSAGALISFLLLLLHNRFHRGGTK